MYCVTCPSVCGFDTPPGADARRLIMVALAAKPFTSFSAWLPRAPTVTGSVLQLPSGSTCTRVLPSRTALTVAALLSCEPGAGNGKPNERSSPSAFL